MNRLVIIGNGFDLAHGLKTSYYDFIFSYLTDSLKRIDEEDYEDELLSIRKKKGNRSESEGKYKFKSLEEILEHHISPTDPPYYQELRRKSLDFYMTFKTDFIRNLIIDCKNNKWVDIEYYYYKEILKVIDTFKKEDITYLQNRIKEHNNNFSLIKTKFHNYIKEQYIKPDTSILNSPYYNILRTEIDYEKNQNLSFEEKQNIQNSLPIFSNRNPVKKSIRPEKTLLLNFNYTNIAYCYFKNPFVSNDIRNIEINHIHGEASNEIVFGFGDELDENYKLLENLNNNECLRYIKSFYYFKNDRLKDLISFIDSDIYEVLIWGHSCGLSDRTLLNMIFENPKCKGIRIYHHTNNQGQNNFTELTQEISRHFKDKQLMRRLVFPFNEEDKMPQINQ